MLMVVARKKEFHLRIDNDTHFRYGLRLATVLSPSMRKSKAINDEKKYDEGSKQDLSTIACR